MLKSELEVSDKNGVQFIVKNDGSLLKFKPWLADSFSFLYDFIMKRSIFPKKFGGDMEKHFEILGQELKDVHGKRVLELATGSGSAVNFLPNDNQYVGTDISAGLLRKAVKNFRNSGFRDAGFYATNVDDLPFCDNYFDVVLCILSLNFFNDKQAVFKEIKRVSHSGTSLLCSVPVPERNDLQSTIRGQLLSETELKEICHENGLDFKTIPVNNGTLLYFRAVLQ